MNFFIKPQLRLPGSYALDYLMVDLLDMTSVSYLFMYMPSCTEQYWILSVDVITNSYLLLSHIDIGKLETHLTLQQNV